MRPGAGLVALALAVVAAAPARAENAAELACPVANMTAADRGALGQLVASSTPNTDGRYARFRMMVGQCAQSHGWSERQARFVLVHQLSAAGQAWVRAALGRRNVPLAEIEQAVLADAEFMAAAGSGQMSDAAIGGFVNRHQALVERLTGADASNGTGELLGQFIMFSALAEVTRRQFIDS